ncbi:RHS repeat-associated core domain-containing protein [Burkholderia sp. RF4-BP95]|uniref:RHS repeat-associated core domain-containing protein n=1 Tax=Burkholderia sp. RF4-BP95 TaxID=1637845 RepID=UPI0009E74F5D|nr:RHS repeat-associated core domain-containing protein [Burkholderia sp. RF4-BP95]
MALPAVKHLDPVVGVDVHSVLVTPGTPPVFLPHPHVGFMLDLREYVQAAKAVVGCIAMMIVQEKVTEYIEDHPEDVEKLAHLADEANQQVNDLMGGGKLPDFKDDPNVAEGMRLAKEANKIKNRISDDLGSNVGSGGSSGRPIFVNGMMRATAGTHVYHVPGLHFPLGESFAPPDKVEPSNDGESFMGGKTVLANNDPMSYMALEALSCWSVGMEPPPHNSAHTDRTYPSMPSSVMLPIPAGRPVLVGGPPIMNMAAAAKGLFKAFRGSGWAKKLADRLHLKPGFLRCVVLDAEPVDSITGEVVVQQHDFTVEGRLPLAWNRHYASHDTRRGAIGVGWQTPADIRLELIGRASAVGVAAYFPDHATAFDALPDAGGWPARVHDWQHGHALYRHDDRLVLRAHAGIEYEFALPAHWQHVLDGGIEDATLTLPVGRMADLNGNAWVFERGADRSLTRLTEWKGNMSTGRMIECEAGMGSAAGRHAKLLTALTLVDAGGRAHPLAGYEHDDAGNLIAALDAMSQPHHFAYVDGHRMVRHTSARGVSFRYSHHRHDDGLWRVDHAWGDDGLFDYRFVYDLEHRETWITDSLGHTTILQANERGMPVARVDPLGGVWSYGYDAQARASAETDPAGRMTAWEYDAYGNLLAQTLPDGSVVRAAYDAHDRPVCVAAPGDRQWRYAWDERGNLLEQTTPTQAIMRYEYDRHGQLVAYTGPRGAVTRFDYDRDGNLEVVTDAFGRPTRYTHDARANITQTVNALGQMSRYEYDRNGNLTRAIEPGGREFLCGYDADGNLTRYRDPNGQVTQLDYSPLGRITRRVAPGGSAVEYRYDSEAQLVGVVNERGELYRLERDALGQIVEEVDYWGQPRRYEYSAAGELLRSIDPLGQAIDYKTDTLGRLVQKRVPDSRQPDGIRIETFSYDRSGNLVVAENPDCRVELAYDALGRVVEERLGDDFVIASVYDAAGNRVERRTRLNTGDEAITHTVRYAYDALDAVSSIQMDDAAPMTFERDALGQIRVEHLGPELRRELSYTPEGLLEKQALFSGTGPLFASEYAYDTNGELIGKRDSRSGAERFQYDPVGRLTTHLDPTGRLRRYLYDPAGDLLRTHICERRAAGAAGATQTGEWVREGEYDDCYHVYDRGGNLVHLQDAEQDLILRWDVAGQLAETLAVRPAPAGKEEGRVSIRAQYEYDAFQRRVRKVVHAAVASGAAQGPPSRVSRFFWDGNTLVGEYASGEDGRGHRVPGVEGGARPALLVPSAQGHAGVGSSPNPGRAYEWVYYPETFRPLIAVHRDAAVGGASVPTPWRLPGEAAVMYFYQNDPNGSPVRMLDASGNIVWEAHYSATGSMDGFGARLVEQPLRLQGQYFDAESRLHYNRYRYYDPGSARFISHDPIGLPGGTNPYEFALNVLGWADPLGLDVQENHENGMRREARLEGLLKSIFGKENVLKQRHLRDAGGKILCQIEGEVQHAKGTEGSRILDFVVKTKDGWKGIEVTSGSAVKSAQSAKEQAIRDAGGIFVRYPRSKKLIELSDTISRRINIE